MGLSFIPSPEMIEELKMIAIRSSFQADGSLKSYQVARTSLVEREIMKASDGWRPGDRCVVGMRYEDGAIEAKITSVFCVPYELEPLIEYKLKTQKGAWRKSSRCDPWKDVLPYLVKLPVMDGR